MGHMDGVIRRDSRSAAFFDAAAGDRLLIKRCAACGRWLPPDAPGCPQCGAADVAWAVASGNGSLVSWAVVPPATVVALVELEEGPWLHTQLDAAELGSAGGLRAGMSVSARFVHPADGESYPVFAPRQAPAPPRRTAQA
jgi:uncharacterized OB-fold protein